MRYLYIGILFLLLGHSVAAQLLGGSATMNFLRLTPGAYTQAMGGLVVATDQSDLSSSFQNPSLLRGAGSPTIHASFMSLPGGTNGYFLSGASRPKSAGFVSAVSLLYVDHGNAVSTDAGGNVLGSIRPREWTVQLSASLPYKERWRGGASLQFAHSSIGTFRSSALFSNVGIRYEDTTSGWIAGAILRHAGFFVRRYHGGSAQELPTELAFGIWKRLKGSPFSFGGTLQRMQRWQLETDALFDPGLSPIGIDNRRTGFVIQFFNHLILSAQVELHPAVKLIGAYNFLRRRELTWVGESNGLTGFSIGLQAKWERFHFAYGRSAYQRAQSTHQLSIECSLKKNSRGWKR
ncbi:MAG: hypothetical protein RL750_846 [Bacteroidota bacterium]